MSPDRWRRIESLYNDALALPPGGRPAFLEAECSDDALREEVERMLSATDEAGGYLEGLAGGLVPEVQTGREQAGDRVGPWRLVRELGRGGMGEVWLAERAEGGFEQTAALKLVRPDLAPADARRFLAERQILARLEHPNIARLLDGGVASDGRPYLAMELVEGEPITDYADRRRLTVNERLALFGQVAEAVHAAHRQLVVHRDLKPSNVLVAETPAGPDVTLLDFGVAKLLGDGDATLTRTGGAPMTPAYAAPEQVAGGTVTTATDVYALGVLLYELLTGRRPYRLSGRARAAVERAVLEADPTRPSDAVTEAEEGAPDPTATGAARRTEPGRLRRRLAGDLDRIALQALEKEPARRYASAEAFAADVRRHLDGLPVEARAGGAAYRARKFVRRHRAAVAAAAVAVLALVGGLGAALWQAAEADRQRDRAVAGIARAERVGGFVAELFQDTNGLDANGDTITARQMLDRGLTRVARLEDDEARGELLLVLSGIYADLGRSETADSAAVQAVLAFRAAGDSVSTGHALRDLAGIHATGRGFRQSIRTYRAALATYGEAAPDSAIFFTYYGLGDAYVMADSLDAAEAMLDVIDDRFAAALEPEWRSRVRSTRAKLLLRQDRIDEAIALHAENVRELRRQDGPEAERRLASSLNDYGYTLRQAEDYVGALAAYREGLALFERTDREGHRDRSVFLVNIAGAALELEDFEAAEEAIRANVALQEEHRPPGHWRIGTAVGALGTVYDRAGRLGDAIPLYEREAAIFASGLGPDHDWTIRARVGLADARVRAGDPTGRREMAAVLGTIRAARARGEPLSDTVSRKLARTADSLEASGDLTTARAVRGAGGF